MLERLRLGMGRTLRDGDILGQGVPLGLVKDIL